MTAAAFDAETLLSRTDAVRDVSVFKLVAATICLIWYVAVVLVCCIGFLQLWRYYSQPPALSSLPLSKAPPVTIIRPVKGLEPSLYQCLAATFFQTYPKEKLRIRFCVSDRRDPALPVLEKLLQDFPGYDAAILVEDEDPELQGQKAEEMGPNPKIRNMSRAYREASGNIVWIIDCNVWVQKGACARMVETLEGYRDEGRKNKFVHLLPLVVDTKGTASSEDSQSLLGTGASGSDYQVVTTSTASAEVRANNPGASTLLRDGGGRLEELFMSSAHAKFYTAINTVLIAPCIVGKSTMFRKSHLDALTAGQGIDYFSENICEDHLIGDMLWKKPVPEELEGEKWGKHAMVFGDLAIQPMAGMSVREYVARRIRWLRVRKFTVTLATLVEPGTECFLCSLYGAFAVTTLPYFHRHFGVPQTWTAYWIFWFMSVCIWALIDWTLYKKLHSGASLDVDGDTPDFARAPKNGRRRPFKEWLAAWLGREALAWPVWAWAVYGGVTVTWRGKRFWVGMDMKVHEISSDAVATANGSKRRNS